MGRPDATGQRSDGEKSSSCQTKLTVAQLLINNAGKYVAAYPRQAVPQVQSTLAKLSLCRTPALGGHEYRCGACDHTVMVPNSCGDRYCPGCSGARRSDWLESSRQLILSGIDHFQVVFTLPSDLSRLALGNRREIYNLLFASAWSALKQTIEGEHGFAAAALMVLHTWNQKLDAHAHVHAVVPGCGLALDGSGIRFAQRGADPHSIGRYLVDADQLRTTYRQHFIRGLTRLQRQKKLKLNGEFAELQSPEAWSAFIELLQATQWVSFIQPPPQPGQSAEHVLKYLTRYLSGGPISDRRIVSTTATHVTFLARAGETVGGDQQQVPTKLTQLEFTRRWSLHILPAGYTRTRRFGGWSNSQRETYLERMSIALESVTATMPTEALKFEPSQWDEPANSPSESETVACLACGSQSGLILQRVIAKPAWSQVMSSAFRPAWYKTP